VPFTASEYVLVVHVLFLSCSFALIDGRSFFPGAGNHYAQGYAACSSYPWRACVIFNSLLKLLQWTVKT
jgi:hypothetical protein